MKNFYIKIVTLFIVLLITVITLCAIPRKTNYSFLLVSSVAKNSLNAESVKNLAELVTIEYTVEGGETLSKIASMYGTDEATLRGINNLSNTNLCRGQKITVINKKGHLNKVKNGETLETIAKKYKTLPENILIANDMEDDEEVCAGDNLFIPGITVKFADFIWPLSNYRTTSTFGIRRHPILGYKRFHEGIDLAVRSGTPVYASANGIVCYAGYTPGYGKMVKIRHKNGLTTIYGHLSKINVRKNQYVKTGQVIGRVGSTGYSTGPHLHFEIRKYSRARNPIKYLIANN